MHIHPLTRRNREGAVYQRQDVVEEQIRFALTLKSTDMIKRARIRDYTGPDYLKEECLVYLIRDYKRRGERDVIEELSKILLARCSKYINDGLQALSTGKGDHSCTVDHAFQDVVDGLFEQIMDLQSDRGDFLQVRFQVVLEKLRISAFNRYVEDLNRSKEAKPWTSVSGHERNPEEEDKEHRTSNAGLPQEEGLSTEQQALNREALGEVLDFIEEPQRTAFILRHGYDWPIETKDPRLPSISKFFRRTPRTISEWLKKAEETIEKLRKERT